jgi:hypothetical protein
MNRHLNVLAALVTGFGLLLGHSGAFAANENPVTAIDVQQKLIDAVAPFTVETGTTAAFFTTPQEPDINQPTIDYVKHYVPASSGAHLEPHVTVGVVPPDTMKKLIAGPFDAFTFAPSAMSVYQIGNFGTARKKLQAWEFKP